MSVWDQQRAQECFDEAKTMFTVENPQADLTKLEGAGEAFDAGAWYGIAACLSVLDRYGIIRLARDGESRE